MLRRFIRDEAGIAMGLAVIVVVIVGVMGAGLLVFVRNDLEAVVEVNRGQRAFEAADAGAQAAERQLTSDSEESHYDSNDMDNIQWAETEGGMTLEGLYSGTADDEVNVTIEYDDSENAFEVISTGEYGPATRRVEAVYERSAGDDWNIPAYHTPGNIEVRDGAEIDGVSMFSEQSIVLRDYDFGDIGNGTDELGNWDSTDYEPSTTYNTEPREVDNAGFGAEDYICGNSLSNGECQDDDRLADGDSELADRNPDSVHGYDSTTDPEFVAKDPPNKDPNDEGTISYPFPTGAPDADALKELAEEQDNYVDRGEDDLVWDDLYPDSSNDRVVFVDLADRNETFKLDDSSNAKGTLVVRCGDLEMQQQFTGRIILLKGEGSGCDERARFTHNPGGGDSSDRTIRGHVYAEGTKDYGINISQESRIRKLPSGFESEIDGVGYGGIELRSWRELYE